MVALLELGFWFKRLHFSAGDACPKARGGLAVTKGTRDQTARVAPAPPGLAERGTLSAGAGRVRARPCVGAHQEAGQSLANEAPPPSDCAQGLRFRALSVRVLWPVTAFEMASDLGGRGTACTVRFEASCGSLAGQLASTPRGDR